MNTQKILIASFASLFIATAAHAELTTTVTPTQAAVPSTNTAEIVTSTTESNKICLIKGTPESTDYKVIRRIKAGKGTYGSVVDVYPTISRIAHRYKADAVINYNGSQRFGLRPWRIVRPVITGAAVKFNSPLERNKRNGGLI